MQIGFDPELLVLLYDVARQMRTRADQRARTSGMTRAQWVILAHLERQPGLSQNELAAIVEVEPITIGRLVDRLEARGLVERRSDPKDRRVWRLQLMPAATPMLREIKKYRAELHELMPGRFVYSQAHWQSEFKQYTIYNGRIRRYLGRFESSPGLYAALPEQIA